MEGDFASLETTLPAVEAGLVQALDCIVLAVACDGFVDDSVCANADDRHQLERAVVDLLASQVLVKLLIVRHGDDLIGLDDVDCLVVLVFIWLVCCLFVLVVGSRCLTSSTELFPLLQKLSGVRSRGGGNLPKRMHKLVQDCSMLQCLNGFLCVLHVRWCWFRQSSDAMLGSTVLGCARSETNGE